MFKQKTKKETVFVGLSGGVDSSVSALRLIAQGYNVVGVFIKTWQPDFLLCNWEAERLDAMRVAAHLGIPFYTCDAEVTYKNDVAMYMIREYTEGRTPNPDVMCNKSVKFGHFLKYALEQGADYIATGHYAQIKEAGGRYSLLRGADRNKDQSYFLWTLTQEQLAHTLFPIGDTKKSDIRNEAEKAGLHTSKKSDSQGVCFLGEVDMQEFLSEYVHREKGDVLDENGARIGTHNGALYYTLGQRHGFLATTDNSSQMPQYVIAKDIVKNTITVSTKAKTLTGQTIHLKECNLIQNPPTQCEAEFRYRQKSFAVHIDTHSCTEVTLSVQAENIELPSEGQSCVLYMGEECLGGGIIHTIV